MNTTASKNTCQHHNPLHHPDADKFENIAERINGCIGRLSAMRGEIDDANATLLHAALDLLRMKHNIKISLDPTGENHNRL